MKPLNLESATANAGAAGVEQTHAVILHEMPLETMDAEERRWQLEWSRRNVED